MERRDAAITTQNIADYSALIDPNYRDGVFGKVEIVARAIDLFDRFEKTEMTSRDRTIRLLDDGTAQCEQSYTLRAYADGRWRKVVQRERLILAKSDNGWRIIGGL